MTGLLVRLGFPEGGNKVVVFLIELLVLSAVGIFSVCEKGSGYRGRIALFDSLVVFSF